MVKLIPFLIGTSVVCVSIGLMGCQKNAVKSNEYSSNGVNTHLTTHANTWAEAEVPSIARAERLYRHGRYVSAADMYRRLADRGDPRAQYALGYMYFYGQGVTADSVQSSQWIEMAAEQNYAPALAAQKSLITQAPGDINQANSHQYADESPSIDSYIREESHTGAMLIGPTTDKDTLRSVAEQIQAKNPSVSTQQVMVALMHKNPHALAEDSINGLKLHQVIELPSLAEINKTSKKDALDEILKWEANSAAATKQ